MALIGYGRVSTDKQTAQRQLDALTEAGCIRIFEETISGTTGHKNRPELTKALDFLREGDMLCVQEVDRLGRNLIDALLMLSELFEQKRPVKILEGFAAGEHRERSFVLDLSMALAEDRRRDISRKTRNGLEAARRSGKTLGRRRVPDDTVAAILYRRDRGESMQAIADALGLAKSTVHKKIWESKSSFRNSDGS